VRLSDIRKLTIKKQVRVRFQLPNQLECVITEQGISQVPGLKNPPDFNLEDEFAKATQFVLETVEKIKAKDKVPARTLNRHELETLAAGTAGTTMMSSNTMALLHVLMYNLESLAESEA
jgi:hypothetical protein